jgi:tRNA uridine 5-carboxymethylaminomethyl modification enzyme
LKECKNTNNFSLLIDEVNEIVVRNKKVVGVRTTKNGLLTSNYVIITSGTYMKSIVHIGLNSKPSGPVYDDIKGKKEETV